MGMFLIFAASPGRKQLPYDQTVVCSQCGQYGHYEVWMTYMVFSVFFLPIFRWRKKYHVRMTCCDSVYHLNEEKGKLIAAGHPAEIEAEDLQLEDSRCGTGSQVKKCPRCGFFTEDDYMFCPKCGTKLVK